MESGHSFRRKILMNTTESKADTRPEDGFMADHEAMTRFIRQWQECTLPKAAWTHAAHVAVAAYFAFDLGPDQVFSVMKRGIIRLNESYGGVNGPDSGYHETLTRFWSLVVGSFVRRGRFASPVEAVRHAVARFGPERDLHKTYYSFDVVKSRRARQEPIEPEWGWDSLGSRP
jgi:hypothetical protein